MLEIIKEIEEKFEAIDIIDYILGIDSKIDFYLKNHKYNLSKKDMDLIHNVFSRDFEIKVEIRNKKYKK